MIWKGICLYKVPQLTVHVRAIIATDSWSALLSIKNVKSCRLDVINEIHQVIFCLHEKGLNVWVPAHVGVEENEAVDKLAKLSLKRQTVDLYIPLSKAEGKGIIKSRMMGKWQQYWDLNYTGRHLYNIQEKVRGGRMRGRNRKEEALFTRLRIGHTGACTMMVVEQIQSYRISFELTKPNHSNLALLVP